MAARGRDRAGCQLEDEAGVEGHGVAQRGEDLEDVAFEVEVAGDVGARQPELVGRPQQPSQRVPRADPEHARGLERSDRAAVPELDEHGQAVAEHRGQQGPERVGDRARVALEVDGDVVGRSVDRASVMGGKSHATPPAGAVPAPVETLGEARPASRGGAKANSVRGSSRTRLVPMEGDSRPCRSCCGCASTVSVGRRTSPTPSGASHLMTARTTRFRSRSAGALWRPAAGRRRRRVHAREERTFLDRTNTLRSSRGRPRRSRRTTPSRRRQRRGPSTWPSTGRLEHSN